MATPRDCMLHCLPALNQDTNLIKLSDQCISTALKYAQQYSDLIEPYKTIGHLLLSLSDTSKEKEQPVTSTPSTSTARTLYPAFDVYCHEECYKKFTHVRILASCRKRKKVRLICFILDRWYSHP